MKNNKIFYFIILGIYSVTFIINSNNIREPYLWFDEAGQFFISKGLNHDSNALEKEKQISDVIVNNSLYNFDPGGFSILLHFWSKISNHHIWLRLLPFLFFLCVVLSFIHLSYLWQKNINIALLLGFIPILHPVILSYGFEVRAFSMETMGAVMCVIAIERLKANISIKNLIFWSCIFSIFMTSRYSLIIVIFVTSIYVLYLINRTNNTFKTKLFYTFNYVLPLLITFLYIYFFALASQNPKLDALDYLPYLSNEPRLLLSPFNILYISAVGLCLFLFIARNRYRIINKYKSLLFIAVTVNVLFILLSFMGKHPWNPISSRCISMIILMLLCFSAIMGEVLKALSTSSTNLKSFLILAVLIFTLFLENKLLPINRRSHKNIYDFMLNIDLSKYSHIYVDSRVSPGIRYLFEYGKFKSNKSVQYPDKFTFFKRGHHSFNEGKIAVNKFKRKQPKINLLDSELRISSEFSKPGENENGH